MHPFVAFLHAVFFHQIVVHESPVYTAIQVDILLHFSWVFATASRRRWGGRNTAYRHCSASTEVATSSSPSRSSLLPTLISNASELLLVMQYSEPELSSLCGPVAHLANNVCAPWCFCFTLLDRLLPSSILRLSLRMPSEEGHANAIEMQKVGTVGLKNTRQGIYM